jgi:hypothetical protein
MDECVPDCPPSRLADDHRPGAELTDRYARMNCGGESSQRKDHGVGAGAKIDDAVLAGGVGDRGTNFFDQKIARRFDGHAGQDGLGRVLHRFGNRGLRIARGWAGRATTRSRTSQFSTNAWRLLSSWRDQEL